VLYRDARRLLPESLARPYGGLAWKLHDFEPGIAGAGITMHPP